MGIWGGGRGEDDLSPVVFMSCDMCGTGARGVMGSEKAITPRVPVSRVAWHEDD